MSSRTHLRIVGDPMFDFEVAPSDDELDAVMCYRREPLGRTGMCVACRRPTTMGIRLLSLGPDAAALGRCLPCWLAGVSMERGIAMHLVGKPVPSSPAEYPVPARPIPRPQWTAVEGSTPA